MIVVENPRFGMLVTMTPNQLSEFVDNRNNGLFSRVLFYKDDSPTKFDSLNPAKVRKTDIEKDLMEASEMLKSCYEINI